MAEPATSADAEARADREWRAHREALLDEALAQSFPASDPPSLAAPRGGARDARRPGP